MFEYKERYCEWKDGEPLDQNEKIVTKWKLKTDCGQDLIVTPHNRWGILRRKDGTICPFCRRIIDVRNYE